jgi:hypothetical protein
VETARKVGEGVVQRFFDGKLEYAHSRKRAHTSYQALTDHPNLAVAASNLWYCVAVFEYYGVLPADVAGALTVGHHRLLAHVADPEQKSRLATQAVQSALTVDELKVAIAAGKVAEPGAKKRGRPPLPAVAKATEPVNKAMAMMKLWNADKVAALAADELVFALELARKAARDLAVWMALLEAGGPSEEWFHSVGGMKRPRLRAGGRQKRASGNCGGCSLGPQFTSVGPNCPGVCKECRRSDPALSRPCGPTLAVGAFRRLVTVAKARILPGESPSPEDATRCEPC